MGVGWTSGQYSASKHFSSWPDFPQQRNEPSKKCQRAAQGGKSSLHGVVQRLGEQRKRWKCAQHWGHGEGPCIYPRTLTLRNHLLGWERGRLQKKPFLVVRPQRQRERQGLVQSWEKLDKHTTKEGGVVRSHLHLHIVMSHDIKSCIYEQTQNSTFRWLWSESAEFLHVSVLLRGPSHSFILTCSFVHPSIWFLCCSRHSAGHWVREDQITAPLTRSSQASDENSPLIVQL